MGNWSDKQEIKKEAKEKDKTRREKLAGYFFDSSKLILAGVVIGGITPLYSDNAKRNKSICDRSRYYSHYIIGMDCKQNIKMIML